MNGIVKSSVTTCALGVTSPSLPYLREGDLFSADVLLKLSTFVCFSSDLDCVWEGGEREEGNREGERERESKRGLTHSPAGRQR